MSDFTIGLPRPLYTAEQVRELDRVAIECFDVPGITLMQRAGAVAFGILQEQWPQARHVLVFAGGGNNGGDGYIVAALAREQGLGVTLVQLKAAGSLSGDAALAADRAEAAGVTMQSWTEFAVLAEEPRANTVVVDAMLGTGLDREVTGDYAGAIDWINHRNAPVLAVDLPSGLHANTGAIMGCAIDADITVSFIGLKQGLLTHQGRDCIGTLLFNDLDIPEGVYRHAEAPGPSAERFDINIAAPLLLPRASSSHKGSYGHVVVIGGDHGFGGAALMAAEAAQRSGAGLVSLITRSAHRPAALARRPEIMVAGTEDSDANFEALMARATVICIGPGLGRGDWSRQLMQRALALQSSHGIPLVIDADGLHLLADWGMANKNKKRDTWILTPHPGEAAVLLDSSVSDVQADRFAAVSELQRQWGGACLLKGSGTLTCDSQSRIPVGLCTEGNPGMAGGGMGDVLSGVLAALLAQGFPVPDSLRCAVAIHGEAGDLASADAGQRGLLATDLFPFIRQLVNPQH